MTTTDTAFGGDLLERCSRFIFEESDLLDANELDRWLELFDQTSVYWLPVDVAGTEPLDTLNLIYDDRNRLGDRVARLQTGFAFSEVPESRTSHLVSNLRLLGASELVASAYGPGLAEGDVAVAGRGTIARLRLGACETFHVRLVWVLHPVGPTFTIRVKRVDLLTAAEPLPLLTFLL
jgi:benzoate/toluate 1,2-dioxygenase subunit beta